MHVIIIEQRRTTVTLQNVKIYCTTSFECDFEKIPQLTQKSSWSTSMSMTKFYNHDILSTSMIQGTEYDLEYEIVLKTVL